MKIVRVNTIKEATVYKYLFPRYVSLLLNNNYNTCLETILE